MHWTKLRRRAGLVVTNSLHNVLPMLLTPLVSLLVIRQTSAAIWGTFVAVLITVQLGVHLVAWGNDTYLLREFSRHPADMADAWQSCLRTRLALFVGLALLAALVFPQTAGWVVLWGLALVLHQSCAVLITYRRDFRFAAAVELAGLALMVTAVFYAGQAITPDWLLRLFALTTLAKATILLLRYRAIVWVGNGRFQPHYFLLALPFFLLGFGGMLNSRIDLYIIAFYFPAEEVGIYQVFSSFLLYIQALAGFILLPFVKTIYRLPYAAIRRMARDLLGLGVLIVPIAMIALSFLLSRLYGILLPSAFYWLGGLAALPLFYFSPIIYALYKAEKQTTVLLVNLLGIGSALILNLILLPHLGLIGAIVAMVLIKWSTLLIYNWQGRRLLPG
jgi:O-antigen/teichoic acid export membrane protein